MSSATTAAWKKTEVILLRIFLLLVLSVTVTGASVFIGILNGVASGAPDIDTIKISPSGFATVIYDADGKELQKLTTSDSNRTAVSISSIPLCLQHAVIAIEDERFYTHNGVDPRGIVRAAVVSVMTGFRRSEGASTITQQLLKNNVFTSWTSEGSGLTTEKIRRKIQEQYLAIRLEEELKDKDLILENYLNTINLGAGTYGVEAAARKYFNKDVSEITLSEAAVIAGITQNPSRYNPIRHPDNNAARRRIVLNKMLEQGYITRPEMNEALSDDVYDRIASVQANVTSKSTVYSYFVDTLTEEIASDLMEYKGYTEKQAYQLIFSGGLKIYTTQDSEIQKICDEEYSDPANFPDKTTYSLDWALSLNKDGKTTHYSREMMAAYFKDEGETDFSLSFASPEEGEEYIRKYKEHLGATKENTVAERCTFTPEPQSSLVVMDQKTGYVKAIVGGRGEKTASLIMNRATDAARQPGSTFKILSTYAPALETGYLNLASIIKDEPYTYENGETVHNSTNSYAGNVTVRKAIVDSINVPAVKVLTALTPQTGIDWVKRFGITTIDDVNDCYQPLALGGIYKGVTNLELTAAYAAIANEGTYISPVFYTKILDQQGNVLIDNSPRMNKVISKETAYLLTSALEDVVTQGTGQICRPSSGMPVAGKTGTTSNYNDVWFVGYTPYLTMGIWAGYDDNTKLPNEGIYRDYHKRLWKAIMDRITEKQTVTSFPIPATVSRITICRKTGLLASKYCKDTVSEYFSEQDSPTGTCLNCIKELTLVSPTPTPTPIPTATPIPEDILPSDPDGKTGDNDGEDGEGGLVDWFIDIFN